MITQRDEIAQRIRAIISLDPRVTEKKMFGSVAFLLNGHILVAARRSGTSIMVQAGAEAARTALATPGATIMTMRGRKMVNFLDVEADRFETDDELEAWIRLAERYVAGLPEKP